MDIEVARASERVAAAADAWLRDPRDTTVYGHLVAAVEAWRRLARPTLQAATDDVVEPERTPARLGAVLQSLVPTLRRDDDVGEPETSSGS